VPFEEFDEQGDHREQQEEVNQPPPSVFAVTMPANQMIKTTKEIVTSMGIVRVHD